MHDGIIISVRQSRWIHRNIHAEKASARAASGKHEAPSVVVGLLPVCATTGLYRTFLKKHEERQALPSRVKATIAVHSESLRMGVHTS